MPSLIRPAAAVLLAGLAATPVAGPARADPQNAVISGSRIQPNAAEVQRKLEARCAQEEDGRARAECRETAREYTRPQPNDPDLGTSGSTRPPGVEPIPRDAPVPAPPDPIISGTQR